MDVEEFKKKSIARQLKALRKDMGMTQKQFGEDLGSSKQAVNNMERGRYYPSFKYMENLYYVYGVSPTELLETAYAELEEFSNDQ